MSATCCGLDFGTSNSTIGIINDNKAELVPLDGVRAMMRSAIFCDMETKSWVFGQEGVDRYLEGTPGRLMMALKSVLGSPLMKDETLIFNEFISYSQILGHFIKSLKHKAEQHAGCELTQVVLGRPVHFHDTDREQDKKAQATLADVAREVGFKDIHFQFEPIAAAMTYEATLTREELALIVDMGGGTSDFTVIRLQPNNPALDRQHDVLGNDGIHIAGTDFDQSLSLKTVMPLLGLGSLMRGSSSDITIPSSVYFDMTQWHLLNSLYSPLNIANLKKIHAASYEKLLVARLVRVMQQRNGHRLLHAVEHSKQQLSDHLTTNMNLDFIEDELAISVQQAELNASIHEQVDLITQKILQTVKDANTKPAAISAIFYTGGSSKIPMIQNTINTLFPEAKIIQGDAFGSVGMGLTLQAAKMQKL